MGGGQNHTARRCDAARRAPMSVGDAHDHGNDGRHRAAARPRRLRGHRPRRRRGVRRLRALSARRPLGAHAHPQRLGQEYAADRDDARAKPVHVRILSRRHRRTDGATDFCQRHPLPHALRRAQRHAQHGSAGARGEAGRSLYRRRRGLHAEPGPHRRLLRTQDARADQARRRCGLHQGPERAAHSRARAHAGAGAQGRLRRIAAASAFALPDRACPLHGASRHRARRRRGAYGDLHSGERCIASRHGGLRAERAARRLCRAARSRTRSPKSPSACVTSPRARASRSDTSSSTTPSTTSTRCPAA